jgi:hypothetical protein
VCPFGIYVCSQSGNHHPYEKIYLKKKKPLLATENFQNLFFFEFLVLNFYFWQNLASKKNLKKELNYTKNII